GVLAMTPEADWAASVTGHLGPDAPLRLDGIVYVGIAHRTNRHSTSAAMQVRASRHSLAGETRIQRQREAASLVLGTLLDAINAWREEQ
ncbi:MAG: damage-inducible protein, partial [Pirellulaceae bacterium]